MIRATDVLQNVTSQQSATVADEVQMPLAVTPVLVTSHTECTLSDPAELTCRRPPSAGG